jgi:hypothetical protein
MPATGATLSSLCNLSYAILTLWYASFWSSAHWSSEDKCTEFCSPDWEEVATTPSALCQAVQLGCVMPYGHTSACPCLTGPASNASYRCSLFSLKCTLCHTGSPTCLILFIHSFLITCCSSEDKCTEFCFPVWEEVATTLSALCHSPLYNLAGSLQTPMLTWSLTQLHNQQKRATFSQY